MVSGVTQIHRNSGVARVYKKTRGRSRTGLVKLTLPKQSLRRSVPPRVQSCLASPPSGLLASGLLAGGLLASGLLTGGFLASGLREWPSCELPSCEWLSCEWLLASGLLASCLLAGGFLRVAFLRVAFLRVAFYGWLLRVAFLRVAFLRVAFYGWLSASGLLRVAFLRVAFLRWLSCEWPSCEWPSCELPSYGWLSCEWPLTSGLLASCLLSSCLLASRLLASRLFLGAFLGHWFDLLCPHACRRIAGAHIPPGGTLSERLYPYRATRKRLFTEKLSDKSTLTHALRDVADDEVTASFVIHSVSVCTFCAHMLTCVVVHNADCRTLRY